MSLQIKTSIYLTIATVALSGCGDDDATPAAFGLEFVAMANGEEVDGHISVENIGPNGNASIRVADLRFYVSELELLDSDGNTVETVLDENEFQYAEDDLKVAMIDLTDTKGCELDAIVCGEATDRKNAIISGTTRVDQVAKIRFAVGVSQPLMKRVISSFSQEGAPSPLNEMYWSWQTGYRHFVMNFAVATSTETGEGYIHVGSTGCAGLGELALESRDECERVNTAYVELDVNDLATQKVAINIDELLSELPFVTDLYGLVDGSFAPIGRGLGIGCHSNPASEECAVIFSHFGLDNESGEVTGDNKVFSLVSQ